ncbi:helix-turn-helix transcriptional regulator [Clostridium sp. Sa3CUN1]|uniref:Helix-turn-helix transcriptional regulator n=1 Tax=Clostridium gallinarum TaxID=2762246 RepID=A0ABR8Q1X3_9CLOT|nr:AraC family transcriptional regulator [Clostridium gallinarum]MBD7914413.1 helix-turn-helix transcriptional regulator [Clostridium gallinarum]
MLNDNLLLKSILDKFNLSTQLQITCVNKDKKLKVQSSSTSYNLLKEEIDLALSSSKKLQNYIDTKMIEFVSLEENKEVGIIYINLNNEINDYFILGPFSTTNNLEIISYPYRPKYCITYIADLLLIIIKDSKSFNCKITEKFFSLNIKKTIEYIHKNYDEQLTIDSISKMLNIHKCYFCNSFKKETGMTFTNFLCKFRVEKSKELLLNPSLSILDIAISVGFNNQSYYTMMFKKLTNLTPLEYRKSLI